MAVDHLLFIGFGGPTRPDDVQPFLEVVTRGMRIPPARLAEVARHYAQIGGCSPYNRHAMRLVESVTRRLREVRVSLPVFVGMRNWHPFLRETMTRIHQEGLRRGLGVVLAPHRCEASFERYVRSVDEARAALGAHAPSYEYLDPWHDHPGFIRAQAAQVEAAWSHLRAAERAATTLVFSAHSIPVDMARACRYVEEFQRSSRLVAQALGHDAWSLAYQSRSGSPQQPWLEPDILSVLGELKPRGVLRHGSGQRPKRGRTDGVFRALVVPIGFLLDHTEVLYDLDIEARAAARRAGLEFLRASTVMEHPAFVGMFAELITAR